MKSKYKLVEGYLSEDRFLTMWSVNVEVRSWRWHRRKWVWNFRSKQMDAKIICKQSKVFSFVHRRKEGMECSFLYLAITYSCASLSSTFRLEVSVYHQLIALTLFKKKQSTSRLTRISQAMQ